MSVAFNYRPTIERGALDLNECMILRADAPTPAWLMHFCVRTVEGLEQTFRVPVNPNGPHIENGPLGRTWGLQRCGQGEWRVSPSIDFGNWHQTPKIVGVPDGEPWLT